MAFFRIAVYVFGLLALCLVVLSHVLYQNPIEIYTRDTSVVLNGTPFHGIISNIGALFWISTAVILFSHYNLLKKIDKKSELAKFVLFGAILSFILLIDDFFMLHEWFFPDYLGISQRYFAAFYGIYLIVYLLKYKYIIFKSDYLSLLLALFFFSISNIVDRFPYSFFGEWHLLYEDGPKFLGIICWLEYFSTLVKKSQVEVIRQMRKSTL